MRPRTTAVAMLFVLSGCPKAVPQDTPAPQPLTAEQQLTKEVAALRVEALALVKEQDELLWAHWTQGAALDLEKPALRHAVLFEEATLSKVRGAGDRRLEVWLVGERLARATAEANAALTGQEAIATFPLDGKTLALNWRDLNRLLANEKSAVKRKALWAASLEAIPPLAGGYQKRDDAVVRALVSLGTSPEAYAGVTSEESAALGAKFLDDTEAEWKAILQQLAKSELGLPVDKVTRADLPRMLRPNTAADQHFPKQEQAAKATELLAALGLYGLPGLTLDLAESTKKNPLPLTVAPNGSADVRVSFRPAGGARDASALLGEVGRALAMHEMGEPRLASPLVADASFRLFAELAAEPQWLKLQGVSESAAASTIASSRALRLYSSRRAAGNLVAQHRAIGQSDAFAAQTWREWSARALAISVSAEDSARWRLERDPLYRGVEVLRGMLIAEELRKKLSAQWWAEPASTPILRAAWTANPVAPVKAAGFEGVSTTGAAGRPPPDVVVAAPAFAAGKSVSNVAPPGSGYSVNKVFSGAMASKPSPDDAGAAAEGAAAGKPSSGDAGAAAGKAFLGDAGAAAGKASSDDAGAVFGRTRASATTASIDPARDAGR